ncbi:MAG: YhfX family PLP-dependent enzyme [Firmicutes bacterium]|nr:YhfX family PLP-dependent enzyme [Bacillota bacterium]
MFLDVTCRRNPGLIRAAVRLHQSGRIWPNTYVVDLDAVEANARLIAGAARSAGISLYFMTKQLNRNPEIARAIASQGIARAVAVDWEEAMTLDQAGVRVGHVGHLVQLPCKAIGPIFSMKPEVITVFSLDKAAEIAAEAINRGMEQPILLRVVGRGDWFHPGQVGGIAERDLPSVANAIAHLGGVKIAGVTSFPCVTFDERRRTAVATPNMRTLRRCALLLEKELGIRVSQVNAPSMTAVGTMDLLAREGATHAEPGHSLTGTTPLHARSDQPETPAVVYVTEVSHVFGGRVYCFGGGFYPRSQARAALSGRDPDELFGRTLTFEGISNESIDYYGTLINSRGLDIRTGDTVVFAFRAQMFASRSSLALARRVSSDDPDLVSVYSPRGDRRETREARE